MPELSVCLVLYILCEIYTKNNINKFNDRIEFRITVRYKADNLIQIERDFLYEYYLCIPWF